MAFSNSSVAWWARYSRIKQSVCLMQLPLGSVQKSADILWIFTHMSYTEWKPWIISTAYTFETLKNNGHSIGPCQDLTGTNALSIVFQCFKCVSWFLNGAIVGRWTYFWIWTYYQGLTVYTFRGISRHFWKGGPINFNFPWGPCTPCPKAMGVRGCHPRKIVKICMRNGAFFPSFWVLSSWT